MKVTRAVITAAAPNQRTLPLQTLVDSHGIQKPVIGLIIEEARRAGIDEICVIVCPGDETAYRSAVADHPAEILFVPQTEPLGYGHALYCARDFVGDQPFLHMVGDHVYLSRSSQSCAQQVVEVAQAQSCPVSGVESTREALLPYFGTIGGRRVKGTQHLYTIDRVLEKPTPTEAEQYLTVPGLRAGHYLGFFGIHVLTPTVMDLLGKQLSRRAGAGRVELSPVLGELASQERYLALQADGRRYPVDVRYGLLRAQLALALSGQDRDEVLVGLCELLAEQAARPGVHGALVG